MSILSRESLDDGSFRDRLARVSGLAWSDEQIARSLADTLAARPPGPLWVFGYGSLMWNPLLHHVEQRVATVEGWHRSFCLRSTAGRGQPERPGRMLSLQAGGQVQGLALRLDEAVLDAELRLLWRREMSSGAYRPTWVPLSLAGAGQAMAVTFVADPDHPGYEADASVPTVARQVATAAGQLGRNVDYVQALARALVEHGLRDPYVDAVLAAVDEVAAG